jgi:hypothetical protein
MYFYLKAHGWSASIMEIRHRVFQFAYEHIFRTCFIPELSAAMMFLHPFVYDTTSMEFFLSQY